MNPEQSFNEQFKLALSETVIVFQPNAQWHLYSKLALEFASPLSLGIPSDEFENLVEAKSTSMNCYQFALLNNNLESRTCRELNLNLKSYCILMKQSHGYQKDWKAQTEQMRVAITDAIRGKITEMHKT